MNVFVKTISVRTDDHSIQQQLSPTGEDQSPLAPSRPIFQQKKPSTTTSDKAIIGPAGILHLAACKFQKALLNCPTPLHPQDTLPRKTPTARRQFESRMGFLGGKAGQEVKFPAACLLGLF